MAQVLKAGILGTGFMGQTHAKRLSGMDGVEIAAICDTNKEAAAGLKKSSGADSAGVYTDFLTMIDQEHLDILYVCLPPFAHTDQVVKAAEKGIHVFLEKPIAPNVALAEKMAQAIEKAGVKSQVGYHMRFRKGIQQLKAIIDQKKAGKPTLMEGRFWCNFAAGPWWRDKNRSGGQVYEQVIHLYDLALHLFGSATSVSGLIANLTHGAESDYTVEDTSAAMLSFANGAMGTITGSNCAVPERFFASYRFVFEYVTLEYHTTGDWRDTDICKIFTHDKKTAQCIEIKEDSDPYLLEDIDFIEAIRNNSSTTSPVRDGLNGIALVTAMLKSAELNGAQVKMK